MWLLLLLSVVVAAAAVVAACGINNALCWPLLKCICHPRVAPVAIEFLYTTYFVFGPFICPNAAAVWKLLCNFYVSLCIVVLQFLEWTIKLYVEGKLCFVLHLI